MTHSFDRFAIVDWSGSNVPKRGKDSIWIAHNLSGGETECTNPATRAQATADIATLIETALQAEERLLIGADFAFGYPAGFARAVGLDGWQGIWAHLHDRIDDDLKNNSNRFKVAAEWNRLHSSEGPFWGRPQSGHPPAGLLHTKPKPWDHPFAYKREAERRETGAKSTFQLFYNGSVGSQTLLGIARLEQLRRHFAGCIAIWPFETGFAEDLSAPIVIAEIYPSRHAVPDGPGVKDKRQVEAVLRDFEAWNGDELLRQLSAPSLTGAARRAAICEEGWLLGL